MFIYMHYGSGGYGPIREPQWAQSLRGLVPAYGPGYSWEVQEESLAPALADRDPVSTAQMFKDVFQLDDGLWKPLSEARDLFVEADHLGITDHVIWRDQWLLTRADVVVTDVRASTEIPLLAAFLRTPVVGVSFSSRSIHPWMAKCVQMIVQNPVAGEQILTHMGVRFEEEPPEGEDEDAAPAEGQEVIS